MASAAKTLVHENPSLAGDWKVVLPRRGKAKRSFTKTGNLLENPQQWVPTDIDTDHERETRLMQKMQLCVQKLESSQFYHLLLDQMRALELSNCISRVLGSSLKMQMVIYGIGSIESYEPPRLQLSLAILLRRKFNWIGDIEVFDPIISSTESRVFESLGCSVLLINEQGRRNALKPTLFFMPHCEAELYDNLLHANWRIDLLKNIVLFGNSFGRYEQYVSEFKSLAFVDKVKHILAVRRVIDEFEIKTISDDYFAAFHDSSWHVLRLDSEKGLHSLKL